MNNTQELKRAGLKVTIPRARILTILENNNNHLSAEEIYQILLEENETIGLATIYRVLTQFETAGLVLRHQFEGGRSVYELDNGVHHDHMVCVETGNIIEFNNETIEQLQHQVAEQYGYEIVDHTLTLYVKPKPTQNNT